MALKLGRGLKGTVPKSVGLRNKGWCSSLGMQQWEAFPTPGPEAGRGGRGPGDYSSVERAPDRSSGL